MQRFGSAGGGVARSRGRSRSSPPPNRNYLRNAYRVLLTRARQGMVIFVPPGDPYDATRSPEYYDSTFEDLANIGTRVIGASEATVA